MGMPKNNSKSDRMMVSFQGLATGEHGHPVRVLLTATMLKRPPRFACQPLPVRGVGQRPHWRGAMSAPLAWCDERATGARAAAALSAARSERTKAHHRFGSWQWFVAPL